MKTNKPNKQSNTINSIDNKDDLQASRMKTIYTQLITQQAQKLRPFGLTEERFRWQNLNVNNHMSSGIDIDSCKIPRMKHKDNLQGGIGNFYNKKPSIKEKRHDRHNNSVVHKKKTQSPFANINSQRVIQPDENKEMDHSNNHHKKFIASSEKMKHSTDGSFASLINKTPMQIEYKTKKLCNRSFDTSINTEPVAKPKIRINQYRQIGGYSSVENPVPGRKHFNSNKAKFVF